MSHTNNTYYSEPIFQGMQRFLTQVCESMPNVNTLLPACVLKATCTRILGAAYDQQLNAVSKSYDNLCLQDCQQQLSTSTTEYWRFLERGMLALLPQPRRATTK
jgi:hypothetical protein